MIWIKRYTLKPKQICLYLIGHVFKEGRKKDFLDFDPICLKSKELISIKEDFKRALKEVL